MSAAQRRASPRRGRAVRLLAGLALLAAIGASAGEFRTIRPIPGPGAGEPAGPVTRPVERELIEAAVREVMAAWGSAALADKLAASFYDGQRLLDTVAGAVPRDAVLRVLSVERVQTLSQREETAPGGERVLRSVVSATVRTQLELEDPAQGFQRREGTNELLLEVTQTLGP